MQRHSVSLDRALPESLYAGCVRYLCTCGATGGWWVSHHIAAEGGAVHLAAHYLEEVDATNAQPQS